MRYCATIVLMWMVGTAFGGSFQSGLFTVNTSNLTGQTSSMVFSISTDGLFVQQASGVFTCETDQLLDQQASPLFSCDSHPPKFGSAVFMADTHTIPLDFDGNGLPNIWENLYFNVTTGTVATADIDGDGNNNRDEYVSGTDPLDDQSIFGVYLDKNTGILEWHTVLNRLYTLEYTYSLTNAFAAVPGYEDVG